MRKRLVSALLVGALGLSLLAGSRSDGTPSVPADGYAYEQELNIIDDKYRNYYEIFVASFYDSDGDGMGDFNGIAQKLDYIQDMGFGGIWLMPVMPSPSYHKYDTTDYMNVDAAYGTLEDFRNLVNACHERNIRIVVDFVVNHSSNEHPWFQEAYQYLQSLEDGEEPDLTECPYVDYYHFSKDAGGGDYSAVNGTDYKYESVFYYTQPDLNWANEAVRSEFEDIIEFWVKDVGIDGFRVDAAMHFEEGDTAFNIEVLNWIYERARELNPDFYMVSEVWSAKSTVASYYESQTDSMFNFDCSQAEGKIMKAARGGSAVNFVDAMIGYKEEFGSAYADYIDAPFLTNHDMTRVSNALVSKSTNMKMAAALLATMNGNPFVYYGEEIGMKSVGTKDENKRLAMYWSAVDPTGMTNSPVGSERNVEHPFPPVDEQLADEKSILNFYKRAFRIRNENPEIARGEIKKVDSLCADRQAAITKTYEDSVVAIVYNTGLEETMIDLKQSELGEMQIRGYMNAAGGEVTLEEGILTMPAQSICILK